ncbi:MAG: cytochrome c3 family protein [Armatimonadetes bacterium]|nr:cytochrome c3 family protein [Armatimonadota bacterium]
MSQIFHRSSNMMARLSILVVGGIAIGAVFFLFAYNRSDYFTNVHVAREQPVPFSHARHVGQNGIDCRYCHTSVTESNFAGIPPTETCMTCHSQVLPDAPMLEPVRTSFRSGKPLEWTRVHDLPDFVYFNHSIHVAKGVGCATCHGQVDKMPLLWKTNTLQMDWCLNCHRNPEQYLRPREHVFDMNWKLPAGEDQIEMGKKLVKEYNVNVHQLTNCSICHR